MKRSEKIGCIARILLLYPLLSICFGFVLGIIIWVGWFLGSIFYECFASVLNATSFPKIISVMSMNDFTRMFPYTVISAYLLLVFMECRDYYLLNKREKLYIDPSKLD